MLFEKTLSASQVVPVPLNDRDHRPAQAVKARRTGPMHQRVGRHFGARAIGPKKLAKPAEDVRSME